MDVREAVKKAREHILEMFADENVSNVGLEEVDWEGDPTERIWRITIGFSRPWDEPRNTLAAVARLLPRRTYKVVRIDKVGQLISITSRDVVSDYASADT